MVPQKCPLDFNWAEVNRSQTVHTEPTKELFCNAWLSWLSSLLLSTFLAGEGLAVPWQPPSEPPCRVLCGGKRSWSPQCQPGLNRRGNSITLGGGPCRAAPGSLSCWGWSRKEAVAVLAELPPVGMAFDWLFSIAEGLNWGKNNLDVHETDCGNPGHWDYFPVSSGVPWPPEEHWLWP